MAEDTTIHYLVCNPELMFSEMNRIYRENGGDILFPGDEKSILLRTVLQVLVQAYAAFDNAARMRTLRYAVGEYLDIIAEKMRLRRNLAEPARVELELTIRDAVGSVSIPKGSLFSFNGILTFETTEYAATITAGEEVKLVIPAQCTDEGEAGNGLEAGTILHPIEAVAHIVQVKTLAETTGGREREQDDAFRERLLASAFNDTVTGPELMYTAKAMDVSSGLIDASAVADNTFIPGTPEIGAEYGLERGQVLVTLLFGDTVSEPDKLSIIDDVYEALRRDDERPLTDCLIVREAETIEFSIKVRYMIREGAPTDAITDIMAAVAEFREWQTTKIGRAFDPYKLTSMLYNANCARVEIVKEESSVGDGPCEYTLIPKTKRLIGQITMEEITYG